MQGGGAKAAFKRSGPSSDTPYELNMAQQGAAYRATATKRS
jgi:hypothetical protein